MGSATSRCVDMWFRVDALSRCGGKVFDRFSSFASIDRCRGTPWVCQVSVRVAGKEFACRTRPSYLGVGNLCHAVWPADTSSFCSLHDPDIRDARDVHLCFLCQERAIRVAVALLRISCLRRCISFSIPLHTRGRSGGVSRNHITQALRGDPVLLRTADVVLFVPCTPWSRTWHRSGPAHQAPVYEVACGSAAFTAYSRHTTRRYRICMRWLLSCVPCRTPTVVVHARKRAPLSPVHELL